MKTGMCFQVLPRVLVLAGFLSLGLVSVASADEPTPGPQSHAADVCPADAPADPAGLLSLSPGERAVPADASCGSGYTLTYCSCGSGCRPTKLSPQNFCKFYLCGD